MATFQNCTEMIQHDAILPIEDDSTEQSYTELVEATQLYTESLYKLEIINIEVIEAERELVEARVKVAESNQRCIKAITDEINQKLTVGILFKKPQGNFIRIDLAKSQLKLAKAKEAQIIKILKLAQVEAAKAQLELAEAEAEETQINQEFDENEELENDIKVQIEKMASISAFKIAKVNETAALKKFAQVQAMEEAQVHSEYSKRKESKRIAKNITKKSVK